MQIPYKKSNPSSIQSLFDSIADQYDFTNSVLSFGLHKYWNRQLAKSLAYPSLAGPLLDLCCGTGEIAYTFLKLVSTPQTVHLVDFCSGMLEQAKMKAQKNRLENQHHLLFTQGDAQAIPLSDTSIAGVTIAYGIRNIQNPLQCLKEVFRVLQLGGRCGILELTRPQNRLLRACHRCYLRTAIPILGRLCTSNQDAYQYLQNSIHHFVEPKELMHMMQEAGFKQITQKSLTGGIAHLFLAQKL